MNITRQTDLSVEQIKGMLEDLDGSEFPTCLLLNELGIIAVIDVEQSKEAGDILVSELEKDEMRKWTAIRYLCVLVKLGKASPSALKAIEAFKANPENNTILPSDEEIDIVAGDVQ